MQELQQGGNAAVTAPCVTVAFDWALPAGQAADIDPSAYLLRADGKVRGDGDMVFYNQPAGADGAVRFTPSGAGAFEVDLGALSAEIERVVFCVTLHEAAATERTLALIDGAAVTVSEGGAATLRYRPALSGAAEAAMTFGELYRRAGKWKFRAVGQGFNGGLAPLARSFGIDVADDAPAPPAPPLPPPPPPPVRLSKVTLEKRGDKVSLEKKGASLGEISVNLNWSRGRKGFFGGGAIDLDLGCLLEMANGRIGVVQALGRVFGSFDAPPFILLSGDDRTGDVAGGETMRINGARWDELKRVLVFANIYDGVPNWQQTDGVVLITAPGQAPTEVRMTEGRNDRRVCGIALIENEGGRFAITKIDEYFRDQEQLDRRFGWGLRWVAGTKD